MDWAHDIRDLLAAAMTALLYVVPPISILLAIWFFAKKRRRLAWLSACVAIVFLAPLAVFLVIYYSAVSFPERRAAEMTAIPREPVPRDARPHALAIIGEAASTTRLLAVGFLDAITQYPDGKSWPRKFLFTPRRDPSCIEENLNPMSFTETLSTAMLARSAYLTCAAQTRLVEAPVEGPPIELLRDEYATLAIPNTPGEETYNFTYRAWELRWSPARAGKLIDYGEILYVEEPSYYVSWRMGFHHGHGRPAGERRDLDLIRVRCASAWARSRERRAFRRDERGTGADCRNFGCTSQCRQGWARRRAALAARQWGDVEPLRADLAALDPKRAGDFVTSSLALLANTSLDDKRRTLYPKLHEYRDLLARLCPAIANSAACEKALPEIERRRQQGDFGES